MKKIVSTSIAALMLSAFAAGPALAQSQTLTVWWVKGFYKAEDEALYKAIKGFETKTGTKVELSQYPVQDMIPKTVAALDSGSPPDLAYADVYDFQVAGKWAFDGKLEDISDVMSPLKDKFLPNTLETTYLLNGKDNKKAYYAFPIKQQTMHIQYWKDMLAQADVKEADIPKTWDAYWKFWCDTAQPAVRKATGQRIYGIGQPLGVDSSDSFFSFLTFMDAYNVKLVDDNGKLLVDDPGVKKGLIGALTSYVYPALNGCAPPSATSWKDPDNNVAFHNRSTIMTHNATISIAGKWMDDAVNESLTAEQRATAKKNYEENIATAGFPNKPDGSKMIYRSAIKVGAVFSQSKNKALAKQFITYLLQDENLQPYVEGSLGRWYPVTKTGQNSAFWQADSHRKAVYNQFTSGTVNFEFTKNYKFTIANNENVWAVAANRVINEKVPVDKAVDELIARIKSIAN